MGNKASRITEEQLETLRQADITKRKARLEEDIVNLKNYYLGLMTNVAQFDLNQLDRKLISKIRIGLFGPTGAGKSSFINTCERTLDSKGRGTCNIQSGGQEGTIILRDYLHDYFFRIVDTRGFFHYQAMDPFIDIMEGLTKEGAIIKDDDAPAAVNNEEVERPRRSISDQINVVICLINGRDPRNNTLLTNLSRHKQYLRENGITAITVVTHYDKIAEAERDGVLLAASQATGSPINKTFFIANYIIDDCERNLDIEEQAVKVLQYALTAAEQTIRMKLLKEKMNAPHHGNIDVTIICQVHGHVGKQDYTIPAQSTFDNVMETIKHQFKIQNTKDFYFTTPQGKILSGSANVMGIIEGNAELNLLKNPNI